MNKLFNLDWILATAVLLLLVIGLVALWSISFQDAILDSTNLVKQITSAVIGIALMFFLAFYDYRVLNSNSTKLYFGIIILLTAVIFWGKTIRGTTGWIGIGPFHIQPVEMAKLVLLIFLASFLSKKKNQLGIMGKTVASIVLIFLPVFLILCQPDFGSAAIIVGGWIAMLLVCGINKKNFVILAAIGALTLSSSWILMEDYQRARISTFIEPEQDPQGSGYNVIQSIVAVGSGQLWGKGLGHGSQSQLNFLPEKHTDFIFAVISEELGFFGAMTVLTLFAIIFYRIKEIAMNSHDNFGYLLSIGILVMLFLQVLINVGMNIGIIPVTGIPLPFLSYGGSSLVSVLAAIGLVQGVYMRRTKTID